MGIYICVSTWTVGKRQAEQGSGCINLASEMPNVGERLLWSPNTFVSSEQKPQLTEGLKVMPLIKRNNGGKGIWRPEVTSRQAETWGIEPKWQTLMLNRSFDCGQSFGCHDGTGTEGQPCKNRWRKTTENLEHTIKGRLGRNKSQRGFGRTAPICTWGCVSLNLALYCHVLLLLKAYVLVYVWILMLNLFFFSNKQHWRNLLPYLTWVWLQWRA